MEGKVWKAWLVVAALSAFGTSSLPHNKALTYEEAVDLAVSIYNSEAGEDCVYRLLEALEEPQWDPVSESHQELNFTIKETVCLLVDVVFFGECDFKEDGVVRQCTGYFFFEERPPGVVLTCVDVAGIEEENREEEEKEEEKKEEEKKEEKDQPKRGKRFLRDFKKPKKGFRTLSKKKKIFTSREKIQKDPV